MSAHTEMSTSTAKDVSLSMLPHESENLGESILPDFLRNLLTNAREKDIDVVVSPKVSHSKINILNWQGRHRFAKRLSSLEANVCSKLEDFEKECKSLSRGRNAPQQTVDTARSSSSNSWSPASMKDLHHGSAALQTLQFDALCYSHDTLVDLCVEIFIQLRLDETLQINAVDLRTFVSTVRENMRENPYHNWNHAVDVMQTTYSLGLQSGLLELMPDKERFALLIAALCHDLHHPGVSNAFLAKSHSALSSLYGVDAGCLENHHSFGAFQLLARHEDSLLSSFTADEKASFYEWVDELILATDMSRHSTFTAARLSAIAQPDAAASPELRRLMAEMLIKSADTSNVLKPLPVAQRWAMRVTEEFFQQGDEERRRGWDVTPFCDRRSQPRAALQRAFIDAVAAPFYAAVAAACLRLAPAAAALTDNRAAWGRCASDDELLEALARAE